MQFLAILPEIYPTRWTLRNKKNYKKVIQKNYKNGKRPIKTIFCKKQSEKGLTFK